MSGRSGGIELDYDVSRSHTPGGGNWWKAGMHGLLNSVSSFGKSSESDFFLLDEILTEQNNPFMVHLLKDYYPIDTLQQRSNLPENSVYVPLFISVYHDYSPVSGFVFQWQKLYDNANNEVYYNYLQGTNFVEGRVMAMQVFKNETKQMFLDSPSTELSSMKFLRNLAILSLAGKKFQKLGEFVKPVQVNSPATSFSIEEWLPAKQFVESQTKSYSFPRVLSGTFKASDGSLGLLLANYSGSESLVSYNFNLSDYGLNDSTYFVYDVQSNKTLFLKQLNSSNVDESINVSGFNGKILEFSSLAPTNINCSDTVQEVCGSDGKTYNNECLAFVAGVEVVSQGACKQEPPKPECGDGKCETGEDETNCPLDCAPKPVCGNKECEVGEDSESCPIDCLPPSVCGNGKCEFDETESNCFEDCVRQPVCGDGECEQGLGETIQNCPGDCPLIPGTVVPGKTPVNPPVNPPAEPFPIVLTGGALALIIAGGGAGYYFYRRQPKSGFGKKRGKDTLTDYLRNRKEV
ncbi:MAG: DUF6259 domain-containing protein, partial [archaeon]